MLNERKKIMEQVQDRICEECSVLKERTKLHPTLKGKMFSLLDKRVSSFGVRSYFSYALSQYIKRQATLEGQKLKSLPQNLFDTQLPLLAEGIIAVQYLENHILDDKAGTQGCIGAAKEKRDRNLLASHYVKDVLYAYIDDDILPDDHAANSQVRRATRRIFQYVDLGQAMQDEWGTYAWFEKGHNGDISISTEIDGFTPKPLIRYYWKVLEENGLDTKRINFMRNYLRRIFLTSGALFVGIAELEMELLGYNGKQKNKIRNAAASIGILGQIANDICDFVASPTMAKTAEDAFADIRNDIITLPLALYFGQHPDKNIKYLQELSAPELLVAMKPSLLISLDIAAELRQGSSPFFDESITEGVLLEDMNSVANRVENRFLRNLEEMLHLLTPSETKSKEVGQNAISLVETFY